MTFDLLSGKLRPHSVWVIGIQPQNPEHISVVQSVLQKAKTTGLDVQTIYVEPGLVDNWPENSDLPAPQTTEFKNDVDSFVNKVSSSPDRTVMITSLVNSSHLLHGNAIHKLEDYLKKGVLALSIADIGLGAEEAGRMPIPCVLGGADSNGTGPLGCAIHQKAAYMKRKLAAKEPATAAKPWAASLDQWGETDFLLFVHHP